MRKLFIVTSILFLAACSSTEEEQATIEDSKISEQEESENIQEHIDEVTEMEISEEEPRIDTSMYESAQDIEITDALEINDHITLFIYMSEDLKEGLAFQHVTNQTYAFLLQESIKEAKTIGVNVIHGENKIAMFTVNLEDFVEDDSISMAKLVLDASKVQMASPEVEEYAEVMDLELNK